MNNLPSVFRGTVVFSGVPYQLKKADDVKVTSIGDMIRSAKNTTVQAWQYVKMASEMYRKALDMSSRDIESLEDLEGYVEVSLNNGQIVQLIPKNTCGCPYGGSWECLLQPRIPNGNLPNFGGGTTYITALPLEINDEIVKAIKAGRATIQQGYI